MTRNRNYDLQPMQGWGRTSPDYGRMRVEPLPQPAPFWIIATPFGLAGVILGLILKIVGAF